MDDALQELVAVVDRLGTGRCLPREFMGYLQNAKDCAKHKQFSPTSHYCDDLENFIWSLASPGKPWTNSKVLLWR